MTNDYIRREDAVEALDGKIIVTGHENADAVLQYMKDISNKIKSLEPADVVPVVHAYWIPQKENHEFKEAWIKCSKCGYPVSMWTGNTNFCPNCGAKMDGGKNT